MTQLAFWQYIGIPAISLFAAVFLVLLLGRRQ